MTTAVNTNVQDATINAFVVSKTRVSVFLNSVKLVGVILNHDDTVVLIQRDENTPPCMAYKHAIVSITQAD